MYSCDGKAEFSASLLQSLVSHVTWSFRNPSNMLIWCSENLLILLLTLKTVVLFFFYIFNWNWEFKRTAFSKDFYIDAKKKNLFQMSLLIKWISPCWKKKCI